MDLVSTCTRIKNWSKGAKVMQLDGTSFRVKPPPAAADVLRDQPGSARVRGGRAPGRARLAPRGRRLLRRRVALLPRRAPAAPPPARGPTVLPFRPPRGWEGHGAPDRAGRWQMLFMQSYGSATWAYGGGMMLRGWIGRLVATATARCACVRSGGFFFLFGRSFN
jgi:hypothetical protein